MYTKNQIGQLGEGFAINYLLKKNYAILAKNWRFKRAEIDIIAQFEKIIVFIEVKTLSYTYYGQPEEAIDKKKEAFLIDAAQRYMEEIEHDWEIRFDIISIILDIDKKLKKLNHFKDAFFY